MRITPGTYIDRDLVNWEQAVTRLSLGEFMSEAIALGGETYLPQPSNSHPAHLAALIRSLIEDSRFATASELTLAHWARYFRGLLLGYVLPRNAAEDSERRRCFGGGQRAGGAKLRRSPRELSCGSGVASSWDLGSLGVVAVNTWPSGVTVSSLAPMRAIPFRVVFVLGLAEGRFPVVERRDALDLRTAQRRPGDVTQTERDQYVFLEALAQCAGAILRLVGFS